MDNYIHLTKPPTEEEYFRAILYDIPFIVSSYEEVLDYGLFNLGHDHPFYISTYGNPSGTFFRISNMKFKNNVSVQVKIYMGNTFYDDSNYFIFNSSWLKENHYDVYQLFRRRYEMVYGMKSMY